MTSEFFQTVFCGIDETRIKRILTTILDPNSDKWLDWAMKEAKTEKAMVSCSFVWSFVFCIVHSLIVCTVQGYAMVYTLKALGFQPDQQAEAQKVYGPHASWSTIRSFCHSFAKGKPKAMPAAYVQNIASAKSYRHNRETLGRKATGAVSTRNKTSFVIGGNQYQVEVYADDAYNMSEKVPRRAYTLAFASIVFGLGKAAWDVPEKATTPAQLRSMVILLCFVAFGCIQSKLLFIVCHLLRVRVDSQFRPKIHCAPLANCATLHIRAILLGAASGQ